jgi:hypothetical protein
MKTILKKILITLKFFIGIDFLRRIPEVVNWLKSGCIANAPPPIKRIVIKHYLKKYDIKKFIESGTHIGDTVAYVASNLGIKVISIELDDLLFAKAKKRFASNSNIEIMHGDSSLILPKIISNTSDATLFWLDGHFSGNGTSCGATHSPIESEIDAILKLGGRQNVVLIDDVRCFDGCDGYIRLDLLLEKIRLSGLYDVEISVDIMRLTPKKRRHSIED